MQAAAWVCASSGARVAPSTASDVVLLPGTQRELRLRLDQRRHVGRARTHSHAHTHARTHARTPTRMHEAAPVDCVCHNHSCTRAHVHTNARANTRAHAHTQITTCAHARTHARTGAACKPAIDDGSECYCRCCCALSNSCKWQAAAAFFITMDRDASACTSRLNDENVARVPQHTTLQMVDNVGPRVGLAKHEALRRDCTETYYPSLRCPDQH